jgi:hypothetical protein
VCRAAITVATVALAACGGGPEHRGDERLQAELRLSPTPPRVGAAGIRVRATDGEAGLTPPGAVGVAVEGSPRGVEALRFEDGAWVGSLDFPAAGDVRVVIEVSAADGRKATVLVPVRVVRRP